MAKAENGKAKLFALYRILFENADENRGITLSEIVKKMNDEYGFKTTTQTIKNDFALLYSLFNIDIDEPEENTNPKSYRYLNRNIAFNDIEDLYSSINSNRLLSKERKRELIEILKKECSKYGANRLAVKDIVANNFHQMNEVVRDNIETINDAISSGKAIEIECGTDYLTILFEHSDYLYETDVLPIEVFYENSIPYLYCRFSRKEFDEDLRWAVYKHYFYCIDIRKIKSIKKTEYRWIGATDLKRRTTITEQEVFDNLPVQETILKSKKWSWLDRDPNERISLFVSDELLELTNSKFKDVEVREKKENMNHVFISAVVSPNLFGWIFEHGDKVKLLSPMPVVNLYKQYVKRSYEMYCNVEKTK